MQFVQASGARAGDITVAEPLRGDLGDEGSGKVAKGMPEVTVYSLAARFNNVLPYRRTRS